jgi:hypothetical protein
MKLKNRSEMEVERWNNWLAFTPRKAGIPAGSAIISLWMKGRIFFSIGVLQIIRNEYMVQGKSYFYKKQTAS